MKPKIIKILNPIRRLFSNAYSFILASYLGQVIIVLNQVDHSVLDLIFYFFVYSPLEKEVKQYYKVVSSQTMGRKLHWLQEIHKGNIGIINNETGSSLNIVETAKLLIGNKTLGIIISLSQKLIDDTRNPLVHSNYFLGYGNEYAWKLSYHRFHFDKKKDDFDNSPFTLKEARAYLKTVQQIQKKLMELYFKMLQDIFPT